MALSGIFYGTTNNQRIKPKIEWSAVQDVMGNYSDVTVSLYYSRTNTGYTTAGAWTGSITVGDQTVYGSSNLSITYNSNTLAMRATVRVWHEADGTKTVTISAAGSIAVASLDGTDISQTVTLDTIPRASQAVATSGNIGENIIISVTRYADTFTHSLHYRFGQLTGWVGQGGEASDTEIKHTGTSVPFTLPESFYDQIPDAKSGTLTLTCRTYRGDTLIGTTEAQATAYVSAQWGPVLTAHVEDRNEATLALTGDPAVLVRYRSNAICAVDAQGQKGAQIVQRTVNGRVLENMSAFFWNAEADTYRCTATDSRGFVGEYTAQAATIPYVELTNEASCRRTDPTSGNALLQLRGNWYDGSFGAADNALTVTVSVNGGEAVEVETVTEGQRYTADLSLEGLDYRKSHAITVTVSDALDTVTRELTLGKGLPVFDWGETDFSFHVPVICDSSVAGLYIKTLQPGSDSFYLRSRFPDAGGTGSQHQSVLIFGSCGGVPFSCVVTVGDDGRTNYTDNDGLVALMAIDGAVMVAMTQMPDSPLALISADPFDIIL